MAHVLIIEDDPGISALIRRSLEGEGYRVGSASNGGLGLEMALSEAYHLIVLDIMLPVKDGFEVCKSLRSKGIAVPVLMLTARDGIGDRVTGLDLGADDYLPKPFDVQEFLARCRALLRRDKIHKTPVIKIADLTIDVGKRAVERAGVSINLSHREFDLLEALATREGHVLTRENIQNLVWKNQEAYSNIVDVYVRMLRKKVDEGHEVKLIHTVHGLGYMFKRDLEP